MGELQGFMSDNSNIGVQSFCFRAFKDNQRVAELVKECGLSKIELCGVHADFKDEGSFDDVISVYRDAGVQIVSIGVQRFAGDRNTESKYFAFARRAGAGVISADFAIDSVPQSYETVQSLGDEYDINVAIHNHGGPHWLGSAAMLGHVFGEAGNRVGLCLDTAWALDSREDPVAMARNFSDRLYGVHVKDFVFDRARKPEDVVIGQGNLDLPAFVAALKEGGFPGPMVLEYEGDVDNPVPALKQCVAALAQLA